MDNITAIAIDSPKSVFEIGLFDDTGKMCQRKRLTRTGFQKFMAGKAPQVAVGIEAAGGIYHWARWLTSLGFHVKVMLPQTVKASRGGAHKSDRRDVLAIGEAMVRPNVPSVPVKSEAAHRLQALVRVREQAMRHAIQAQLRLRGLLAEFGIVAPKGRHTFMRFVATSLDASPEWQALDGKTRAMFVSLNEEALALTACEARADKAVRQARPADPDCRRLCPMPCIGAINATQLAALFSAPELFRSGRAFASYLGLVTALYDIQWAPQRPDT